MIPTSLKEVKLTFDYNLWWPYPFENNLMCYELHKFLKCIDQKVCFEILNKLFKEENRNKENFVIITALDFQIKYLRTNEKTRSYSKLLSNLQHLKYE